MVGAAITAILITVWVMVTVVTAVGYMLMLTRALTGDRALDSEMYRADVQLHSADVIPDLPPLPADRIAVVRQITVAETLMVIAIKITITTSNSNNNPVNLILNPVSVARRHQVVAALAEAADLAVAAVQAVAGTNLNLSAIYEY